MKLIRDSKFILTFVIVTLLVPTSMITIGTNVIKSDADDIINFNYIKENELYISFNIQDIIEEQLTTEYGVFSTISIPQGGFIGDFGKPQMPVVTRLIAVPTVDVSLDIVDFKINSDCYLKTTIAIYTNIETNIPRYVALEYADCKSLREAERKGEALTRLLSLNPSCTSLISSFNF